MKNVSLNKESYVILTESDKETIEFGKKLASYLIKDDVIALVGELGSGKTWFAKGVALGLGVSSGTVVTSPSFSLVNEYFGRLPFFHMDVYRLEGAEDFFGAGLDEYFHLGGVVAMEWANRWPEVLPSHYIEVAITMKDEFAREISFKGEHERALEIIDSITKEINRG